MAYDPPDEIGESHPKISDAKTYLKRFAYGRIEGLGTTDVDDTITPGFARAFRQFRINVHFDFMRGKRPLGMPDLDPENYDFDWRAQRNMGLLAAPQPDVPPYYGLSWTGTWGAWDNGYGYQALRRARERAPKKLDVQGLGYNTDAFMIGRDITHSYQDMLVDGVNEGNRFALPDRRRKILGGYSGGAGCVVQFLWQWPVERRDEIALILQFGDPNRPPGKTLLGNDPGGHGISEDFPPEWCLDRYYSFTLPGDMYPNAEGLLPFFYDILTRMEATVDFVKYLFSVLVDQAGNLTRVGGIGLGLTGGSTVPGFAMLAPLLPLITGGGGVGSLISNQPVSNTVQGQQINLAAMLFNIPAIVATLSRLLKFLITSDHGKYHITPEFGGLTAEDRAIELILALP